MEQPIKLVGAPGIGRDGTLADGDTHVDGQWVRWQRGRPRKMWGYRKVSELAEISRGLHVSAANGEMYLHSGGQAVLKQVKTDRNGILVQLATRTPAALAASSDNLWQFDMLYDSVSATNRLIAHATPSLSNIDSTTETNVYYGDVRASAILTDTGVDASGGIVALPPYLIVFGADGIFKWSVPNKPDDFTNTGSGTARIAGSKLIVGRRVRGTGAGPAGLIWTQDELVRVAFTTGGSTWNSDVLAETSLMSSRCIVEYDGVFYWPGVDRFLTFSGVQRELPNTFSHNFFFDNVNMAQRQKVFGFKNPRWGEIWWCFPFGDATEANHAIVFNVRENVWYDTPLPESGRSAAVYAAAYPRPFMAGVDLEDSAYLLWQHETGLDAVNGTDVQPIRSFFDTPERSLIDAEQPIDAAMKVARLEPDFIQSQDLTVQVIGRSNFRSPERVGEIKAITETAEAPAEETIPMREVHRRVRFRIESNDIGGDYQGGVSVIHVGKGDARKQS